MGRFPRTPRGKANVAIISRPLRAGAVTGADSADHGRRLVAT
ncbi:hypothetical protein L842_1821 [Mycobacterium intracellulare MIN_052511_1280]|nr:hypothetical protein L842_1821 [Mycobacterium intracellulare MIN_052511_1280]